MRKIDDQRIVIKKIFTVTSLPVLLQKFKTKFGPVVRLQEQGNQGQLGAFYFEACWLGNGW
jgi:hypothetical protein